MTTIWRVGYSKDSTSYILLVASSKEEAIEGWKDLNNGHPGTVEPDDFRNCGEYLIMETDRHTVII